MKRKAFTLIEIMVVMAIIAVLAVLIIGAIALARKTSQETTHRTNRNTVRAGLERNFSQNRRYCGAGAGELSCAASGAALSFQSIANIDIDPGAGVTPLVTINSSCTGNANNNGGGRVINLTATSLTLVPLQADCATDMAVSDQISIP